LELFSVVRRAVGGCVRLITHGQLGDDVTIEVSWKRQSTTDPSLRRRQHPMLLATDKPELGGVFDDSRYHDLAGHFRFGVSQLREHFRLVQ
jgi:hypothetical protein